MTMDFFEANEERFEFFHTPVTMVLVFTNDDGEEFCEEREFSSQCEADIFFSENKNQTSIVQGNMVMLTEMEA